MGAVLHVAPFRRIPVVLAVLAAVAVCAGLLATPAATDASAARLSLVGPSRVTANRPFTVTVIASGVRDLAGYEATVRFNARAVMFGGAEQRRLGLSSTGRGVESLGPVVRPDGIVIGAWSCDTADCVTRTGARATHGPNGRVVVAKLTFTARKSGSLDLGLSRVRLVDTQGRAIGGFATDASVSVASAKPNGRVSNHAFSLPQVRPDGSGSGLSTGRTLRDLTGDGRVSHADATDAGIEWLRARQASAVCGPAAQAADSNGDGCLDIRDVQRIAAGLGRQIVPVGVHPRNRGQRGLTPADADAPIVVDSTGDADDADTADGTCATSTGVCTLRAAITQANADSGPDEIDFAIPGTGVHTITLGNALPAIADEGGPTTIDGYTEAGATPNTAKAIDNAKLRIEITGAPSIDGITIASAGNTVRGLAIFNLHQAIWLYGAGSQDNLIEGNWLGENAAASWNSPAFVQYANGVSLTNGALDNQIGMATLAGRNVISGNAHNGIWFWDEGTDGNTIVNNLLGPAPNGKDKRRNIGRGVDINAMASYNVVGGTGSMDRNVISGNAAEGIEFSHNRMTNENRAVNNFIGTDVTGNAAPAWAANGWSGLHFEDGATENYAIGNVVANSGCENYAGNIAMETSATGNVLQDNHIGISVSGVALGTCAGSDPANDPLWGVILRSGASDNQIGPGNEIADNPGGVWVQDDATDGNTITRNSIHDNGGPGIVLTSANANNGVAAPAIGTATTGTVSGTACANCRVEIFRTSDTAGSAGSGKLFMGATTADGSGVFSVGIDGLVASEVITATATDRGGDTSRFSTNVTVASGTPNAELAKDGFNRSVSGGWGTADVGGTYTMTGSAANASVNGTRGSFRLTTGGDAHAAMLNGVAAANLSASVQFRSTRAPTGGATTATLVTRRTVGGEYDATVSLTPDGHASLALSAVVTGKKGVALGSPVDLGAIGPAARITVGVMLSGVDPTTIRARAWLTGTTAPAWQLTVTDSTAALQSGGSLGVRAAVSKTATGMPQTVTFENLAATTAAKGPPPPPPPPPSKAVAVDTFARTVSSAWGRADLGGTWAVATNYPDYNVNGSLGTMNLSLAGDGRAASLQSVSIRDLDLRFTFGLDSLPTGDGTFVYGVARRVAGNSAYRFKVRVAPTGGVYLQATRLVQGVESDVTPVETHVYGLTFSPGTNLVLRAQATGTDPTTLRMKVWAAGTTEPSAWQYETTDSSAALQAAGAVGIKGYLAGNATSTVLIRVDNFRVTAP